ncbi:hypothetical protein CDAR_254231 [Caerostris darwini]|uniref:Secreted protein n=1 Tax=Caerostris darwini TaxID=1538125 RepID=A0AAV4TV47_9ARAC|nr:hypothetical protein CDAR_254231 [Caerostris darwini]
MTASPIRLAYLMNGCTLFWHYPPRDHREGQGCRKTPFESGSAVMNRPLIAFGTVFSKSHSDEICRCSRFGERDLLFFNVGQHCLRNIKSPSTRQCKSCFLFVPLF